MNTDRFEVRVHGVQQLETAATSTLAHVQQFAVASITETTTTLVVRADVERHVMCEDTIVEQAIAKEITHEVVEMVRRYVFELPLSDVTVVDGEKAVLDCHDQSFVPRTTYDMPSAPRGSLEVSDVTRSSVTLSWLAPTLDGGATIMAHVIEQSRAPVTDVDARHAGQAAD